jgi:hypothetical protein
MTKSIYMMRINQSRGNLYTKKSLSAIFLTVYAANIMKNENKYKIIFLVADCFTVLYNMNNDMKEKSN